MKFSPTVLVWEGITARGLTKLHIIPQKTSVDSSYYVSEILEKEEKPLSATATKLFSSNCDGCFQQDGASTHTSNAPVTWLKH